MFYFYIYCLDIINLYFPIYFLCKYVDDSFVVYVDPKNVEGVDYYALKCRQEKFKLIEPTTNDDN